MWGSQIFKAYIEMELQLGNIDRCRLLYEKYLNGPLPAVTRGPSLAELERSPGETEPVPRRIFELRHRAAPAGHARARLEGQWDT